MATGSRRSAVDYILTVGEMAMDIAVSILVLVLVGRTYGPGGLGIYTFLLSVFVIVSFLAEFGVDKWVEKELAASARGDVPSLLAEAKAAVLVAGVLGALGTVLLGSWAAGADTVARGTLPGFALLAVAVPLKLYSGYMASILHGRGQHAHAARAGLGKRLVLVVLVFFLSSARLRPELLVSVFILAETSFILAAGRKVLAPSLITALGKLGKVTAVFRRSARYYFTQEGLRILFFVDFFVLGFFVSAAREGAYAEASVLARLFLLVPLGAAPLYRVKTYRTTGVDEPGIYRDCRRTAARLFTVHAIAGLGFLLYFPHILRAVFQVQGDVPVFFRVFSLLLPGLLIFIPTVVAEPLFIRAGEENELNRIAMKVFILNAFLNFYLIPFAGVFGAAMATTVSLAVYFFLFSRKLGGGKILSIQAYLLAGAIVYCGYHVMSSVRLRAVAVIGVIAVTLPVLFWVVGLYGQGEGPSIPPGRDSGPGRGEEGEEGEKNILPFPGEGEKESGGGGEEN
ncbi:MAG: hypothetical protein P1S46_04335 [bacterium]|nr:hypothetical protein [bacterium]